MSSEDKVIDQETKVSEEGVVSTHTQRASGRVDCCVMIPTLKVRHRTNGGGYVEEKWPRVGHVYAPVGILKVRAKKEEKQNG